MRPTPGKEVRALWQAHGRLYTQGMEDLEVGSASKSTTEKKLILEGRVEDGEQKDLRNEGYE